MTNEKDASADSRSLTGHPLRSPQIHAARAPTPQACGCGLPVAFDVEKHEFFCIGCGSSQECVCRRSRFTHPARPVKVV